MIVYRICKKQFANDLSGKGAEVYGGRWNSKGVAMLYACESRALCTAEVAVHVPMGIMPKDYFRVSINVPSTVKSLTFKQNELPANWKSFPYSPSTQNMGDSFIRENKYALLKIPSVVVPGDFNYLLNPAHSHFKKNKIVSVEKYEFDTRLFK